MFDDEFVFQRDQRRFGQQLDGRLDRLPLCQQVHSDIPREDSGSEREDRVEGNAQANRPGERTHQKQNRRREDILQFDLGDDGAICQQNVG